jgi:hypothetical protein
MKLSEIVLYIKSAKNKAEKIDRLKEHDSPELRILLKGSYDPKIKWLPELSGIKYKKSKKKKFESNLIDITKTLYNYVETPPNLNLLEEKKKIFVSVLETLYKDDAELLMSVINKSIKSDYKISIPIVKEALGWNKDYNRRL